VKVRLVLIIESSRCNYFGWGGEVGDTVVIPVGKVFESIEHKPIWFTTKSYVISFLVLSNYPHMLLNCYSTHIWRVIQVICCLICNDSPTCNHMLYEMYHMLFKSWSYVVYFLYMLYKLLTCAVQDIFICCVGKFACCLRNSYMLFNFLSYVVYILSYVV